MADELDLTEMRLEIKQLRAEIERVRKENIPHARGLWIAFSLLFPLAIPLIVAYWAPHLGLGPGPGKFSSIDVEGKLNASGQVRAESIYLKDESGTRKTSGMINVFRPEISLRSDNGDAVRVDSNGLMLENERGTLILELNEKGEPVLRSVPKVEKK